MAKQQFFLKARNAVIRERIIVQRAANLKEAIEYGRLLKGLNRTARKATYSSSKNVFLVRASSSEGFRLNKKKQYNGLIGKSSNNTHYPYY